MPSENITEEIEQAIEDEIDKLHHRFNHDVEQMAINLNSRFDIQQDELKRRLSRKFVAKLNIEIDQIDMQVLMSFVFRFSGIINLLASSDSKDHEKKKAIKPIRINEYLFSPQVSNDAVLPVGINVQVDRSSISLGKVVIPVDGPILVRTKRGETQYYVERGSFIKDEVVFNILGNFIPKLNNHRSLT